MDKYVGIEGGGTKFVCAYGTGPNNLQERLVIQTENPASTMLAVIEYIKKVQSEASIVAIGASVFGPLDLEPASPTYGYITSTPKKDWVNFDFVGTLKREFNLPIGFDTDVNAAAISEYKWGAAKKLSDFIYLTIGTGIGGGVIANHRLIHGAMHPELGHILIPKAKDDTFRGICPYHQNCLEGFASGPAIKARWKVDSALDLPDHHEGWDLEAYYLGIALANYTMSFSPKRIVLGGGVMRQQHLLPKIRQAFTQHLGGYIENPTVTQGLEWYIVGAGLHEDAGVLGAMALAELALTNSNR